MDLKKSKKPKICFVAVGLDVFKGGGQYLFDIMPKLTDDFDITLAAGYINTGGETLNYKTKIIKTRRLPYYYGLSDYFFAKKFLKVFDAELKKENFDIIHINQIVGSPIIGLKKFNIPIIYTIHHPVTADRRVAVEESKNFKENFLWRLKYYFLEKAQKKICKNFNKILTVSNASADLISADYKIPREKIKIIYNSVDCSFFKNIKNSEKENAIISVGSYIHPRKGFKYLYEVYSEIDKLGNIKIFDVGRRSLAQIEQLKKLKNIEIFGTIPYDKMIELYSRSKVYVSTSLYEGFGYSLIEAMACGTPALAFGVGGAKEVLLKFDKNLIITPRDTKQMTEKIIALTRDPDFQKKSEEYKTKVVELFNLQEMIKEFENFYLEILKK